MTSNTPTQLPSKDGLKSDLAKVLTVGVGRPTRKSVRDLEVVAERLSDPSLPALRQVEEVVREAIEQLGGGSFAIATALIFGTHEDTAEERGTEKRREVAAQKLDVSKYTMKHDREKRMHEALASHLLKRYEELGGVVAETAVVPGDDADALPEADELGTPSPDQADAVIGFVAPTEPTAPEDLSHSFMDDDDEEPGAPETVSVERDEVEQATTNDLGTASVLSDASEAADDVELAEMPGPRRLMRSRRWLLAVAAMFLLAGSIVALLATKGASSARHRTSTKTLPVPVSVAPFSPSRPTYDYDIYNPNNGNCDDPHNPGRHFGRCGALTGHVLDSFINTPSYGDERYFFGGRLSNQPATVDRDPLTNVTIGSTVVLYAYVDNNTAVNLNYPGASDTHDTRVRVNLQTYVDEPALNEWVLRPEAFISASNAQTVEDGVNLVGPEPSALKYETGSAQLLRGNVTYPLSDSIVGNQGALVGLLYMNGDFPAGNNFDAAAYVELRAHVVPVAPPEIRIVNQVRMTGSRPLHHRLYTKPGDDVEWLLHVSNGDWSKLYNVVARDVFPPHLRLDSGSVTYITPRSTNHLADQALFADGYNLGNYAPRAETFVTFKTKVLGDFPGCQDILRNLSFARSDQTPVEVTDDADIVIRKPGCSKTLR